MNRIIRFMAAITVLAWAAGLTGCTMHVTMNPSSAAEFPNKAIPCKVVLYIDKAFRNYHWEGFSAAELSSLDYDLGSASRNLFMDAFKRASYSVAVVESMPAYPLNDPVLVVHPAISGFNESHSLFIRNANYYAEITYHIRVYDKAGKMILEKDYSARGAEMGRTDAYRNYAAPAEKAMAQAIGDIIDDMSRNINSCK